MASMPWDGPRARASCRPRESARRDGSATSPRGLAAGRARAWPPPFRPAASRLSCARWPSASGRPWIRRPPRRSAWRARTTCSRSPGPRWPWSPPSWAGSCGGWVRHRSRARCSCLAPSCSIARSWAATCRSCGPRSWPWSCSAAARALLLSGEVVRVAPWLDVRVATPSLGPALVSMAGLAAFARGKRRGLVLWAAGALCLVGGWGPRTLDGRLQVTFLDVGQGDAIVIRSPRGRTWMVDTGGSFDARFDVGEAVLGPYLWRDGAPVLRGLVLTHAHPDHVGGVPFLLRAFDVREVWGGIAPRHDRAYDELAADIEKARVPRRAVARGVEADWDGVHVGVLGPSPPARPPWRTRNDDSVVLALRYGEIVLLLTGDVEAAGEGALDAPRAFALKGPHLGGRSSS